MIQLDDIEKEQLRHTVLEVLSSRYPAAVTRKGVLTHAAMDVGFDIDLPCVVAALEFLKGLNHAEAVTDDLGSSQYWRATAHGLLALERSKRPGRPNHD